MAVVRIVMIIGRMCNVKQKNAPSTRMEEWGPERYGEKYFWPSRELNLDSPVGQPTADYYYLGRSYYYLSGDLYCLH
jgi:hypothetical protein